MTRCSHLLLLLAVSILGYTSAQLQDTCYVCRRSDRRVINRDYEFTMTSGEKYTCGELEDDGIDNLVVSNTVCGIFIAWADRECECNGPPIEPVEVIDTTPACNICVEAGLGIPESKQEELVNTGFAGQMPCGFLYQTAADGFIPANLCGTLQDNVGDFCCSIPALPQTTPAPTGPPQSAPTTPRPSLRPTPAPTVCRALYESCGTGPGEGCCGIYDCKVRVVRQPPICSATRVIRQQRQSLAQGRGGAAGRAKFTK
jgi:hypothetical protein